VQVQIAEFFRSFDLNFDKKLTYSEFYKGFTSLFLGKTAEGKTKIDSNLILQFLIHFSTISGFHNLFNEENRPIYIWIDEIAIRNLFLQFDLNQDGFVDFSDFVRGIRVPMCKKRIDVLNAAFETLDYNKDSIIDLADLKIWYKYNFSVDEHSIEKIDEVNFMNINQL